MAVADADAVQTSWSMPVEDTAEVARIRRGVEPLRIAVLAQHAANQMTLDLFSAVVASMPVEPMPIVI